MLAANTQEQSTVAMLRDTALFVGIYLYFTGFVYVYYFYNHFGIPLRQVETPVYSFFVYSYSAIAGIGDLAWGNFLGQKPVWGSILALFVACVVVVVTRRSRRKRIMLFCFLVFLFPFLFYLAVATARADALKLRKGVTAKVITFVFKQGTAAMNATKILKTLNADNQEAGAPGQAGSATPPAGSAGQANTAKTEADTEVPDLPEEQIAEFEALERFIEANRRTQLKTKTYPGSTNETIFPKLYLLTETGTNFYVILQRSIEGEPLPTGYVYEIPKTDVLLSEIRLR